MIEINKSGVVYCSQEQFNTLKANGQLVAGTEYEIINKQVQSQETEITLTPNANSEYYYGELTSLNLTFNTANLGDMFYITFTSGATATVLTVDSVNAIFNDFVPEANSVVEIMGKWNGSKWVVLFSQVGVASE